MNWLLMTKIGILFCFKLLTLVTLSITYVHWAARNEAMPPKVLPRTLRTAMPPPPPPLAVRSRSTPEYN